MIDRYVMEEVAVSLIHVQYRIFDSFVDNDVVCICPDKRDAENIVELLNKQDKGE